MKQISIGINAYEANVSSRVGSNLFAYKLLCELERQTRTRTESIGPVQVEKDATIDWTIYLPKKPLDDFPSERPGWKYAITPPSFLWTQWRLPLALFLGSRHDVFVSLGHYSPRFAPSPTVVCILDLAFLKLPQFFREKDLYQLREWTQYSVKKATHIFTISEYSKKDVIEVYQRKPEEITVIFPGVEAKHLDEITKNPDEIQFEQKVLSQYELTPRKYIVSIGTIQPRKNMINAVKAFESLSSNAPIQDTKLVFVGKPGWMTKEFDEALAQSPVKDRIVVTGFVDDDTKYALLRNAGCSILIGFYEGFGIPAVESLKVGVTPVVANTASLPEVVGEFGVLVDPYSIEDIARGVKEAIDDQPGPMLRSQMHEWASKFSWEESAKRMIETLITKFAK